MADATTLFVQDARFREHRVPEGHPERSERLDAVDRALAPRRAKLRVVESRAASDDEVLRAHSSEHLRALVELEGRPARLDPDTFASPRSLEVARLASGGLIDAAVRVADGDARHAFAAVRPPGHHAERARPMGFCLLNHVVIAAQALRASRGLERIAILDWDVHHGNGTQHLLEEDRDALFISTHQFPFYPGTGALAEQGRGAGEGATLNVPLPAGCGDSEYGAVFDRVIVPVLLEFRPQLLLVSAGFDAHARDPLAEMAVSSAGFAGFAARARAVAEQVCGGRLVLALEGGYDLQALGDAVGQVLDVLTAPSCPELRFPEPGPRAEALAARVREAHARHWSSLR